MKKSFLLFIFLIQIVFAVAQTTFNASVSKNKVGLNEQFSLTYSINASAGNFSPPNLSDFSVISGPSTSSSTTNINGKISKENTYTYYLRAKKIGIYTIASAYLTVNGKKYRSNGITVQVLKTSPAPKNSQSPEAQAKKNVFLELDLSTNKPYVGEQIIATYKLYFSQEIRSPELLESPVYTGFWHEEYDLGDNYPIKEEYRDGKKFQVALLKKLVLIPQRAGKLEIAAMELDVPVFIPTNQRDFFGRRRSRMLNIICSTGVKEIQVKELPTQNKPSNFSGAVGDFEFTTKLDRDSIQINESANLSLRISGTGNLRMVELPKFVIPNDIEAYEPKYKESIKLKKSGLSGYKREESLLIPRNKGTYKVSPIQFNYFNPQTKKYHTTKSPSYTLKVSGNSESSSQPVVINNIEKEDVSFIGKDILYIKTSSGKLVKTKEAFYGSTLFNALLILALSIVIIAILIAILLRKSIIDLNKWKKGTASKQAIKIITSAKETEIHSAIEHALQVFFKQKWAIDRANFDKENLKNELIRLKVDLPIIEELKQILEFCEMARFTKQQSKSDVAEVVAKTKGLIEKLENY